MKIKTRLNDSLYKHPITRNQEELYSRETLESVIEAELEIIVGDDSDHDFEIVLDEREKMQIPMNLPYGMNYM